MPALFAFLHHLAAFALVSAIAIEFVLIRHELNVQSQRMARIQELLDRTLTLFDDLRAEIHARRQIPGPRRRR